MRSGADKFWQFLKDYQLKGLMFGMIIAHNDWHMPIYDLLTGWMKVGYMAALPRTAGWLFGWG